MGLTRQSFLPYTRDQLITILKARVEGVSKWFGHVRRILTLPPPPLQGIECFDPQALELCSRKVAAVSGDARRALNICRRAAEVSQAANAARVTIQHVHEAIEEMSESPMIRAMQAAADHERLCILAVIACGRRKCCALGKPWTEDAHLIPSIFTVPPKKKPGTGVEEATLEALLREHARLCRMRGEGVPSASTVAQVCAALGASRLLCVEPGAHDVQQKIRLNCSADDVFFAYRDDPTAQALSKMEAVAPKDKKKGSGEGEAEEEELIGSATGYDEE